MADEYPKHKVKIKKCELCNQEIPIQLTEHHLKKHTLDSSDDSEPPQKRQKISFKGWGYNKLSDVYSNYSSNRFLKVSIG